MPADTPIDTSRINDARGLYGPDSEAWRLNREATLLLGAGPRALLLQIAHPLIAEGVDQHSEFRADPWARLRATLRSYLAIVYGGRAAARAEIARLNRLHRTIEGPVRDPGAAAFGADRYAARDPVLSMWVHATLIDSTIVGYDAWIEPLSAERRAAFYEETRDVGRAFGIPDSVLPRDYDAFQAYMNEMLGPGGPIHPTETSRSLARAVLAPPLAPLVRVSGLPRTVATRVESMLSAVPSAAHEWTMWPALTLLPPTVREELGIPWGARRRVVARWLETGFRAWRPIVPSSWRQMPQARAADRRIAAYGGVPSDRGFAVARRIAADGSVVSPGILAP